MRELAQLPVTGWRGVREIPASCYLLQVRKAGPGVTRVGELVLPAPNQLQHTGEWSCTSHGQCARPDPVGRGTGEPVLWTWEQESCLQPLPCTPYGGNDKGNMSSPPPPLAACSRLESQPLGHKRDRAGPGLHQVQQYGEQAPYLAWVKQTWPWHCECR